MAAKRIRAALLAGPAAGKCSLSLFYPISVLAAQAQTVLAKHKLESAGEDRVRIGGVQRDSHGLRGTVTLADTCGLCCSPRNASQPAVYLQSASKLQSHGWGSFRVPAIGSSRFGPLRDEHSVGAANTDGRATRSVCWVSFSRPMHSSSQSTVDGIQSKVPVSGVPSYDGILTTTPDKSGALRVRSMASNSSPKLSADGKKEVKHDSDSQSDDRNKLPKDKHSVQVRVIDDDIKGRMYLRFPRRDVEATPPWPLGPKKRNKMLEPVVEKMLSAEGEENMHQLLEELETKWCKNGGSACGRMVYCLKRLIETRDVERTLVVSMLMMRRMLGG